MTIKLPPTPTTQGTPRAQCHEYYFRGLGELPSAGMSILASARQNGACTTSSHSWMEAGRITQQVLSDPSKRQQTIYLAGHSMGGLAAFETAKTLQRNGVKVGALATVDRAFAIESSKGLGIKTQEEHSWPLHLINSFTSMSSIGSFFDAAQQPSHTAGGARQPNPAHTTQPSSQPSAHIAVHTPSAEEQGPPSRTRPQTNTRATPAAEKRQPREQATHREAEPQARATPQRSQQSRRSATRTPTTEEAPFHTTHANGRTLSKSERYDYIIQHDASDTSVMTGGVRLLYRGSSEYDAAQHALNQNAPRQPKGRGRG